MQFSNERFRFADRYTQGDAQGALRSVLFDLGRTTPQQLLDTITSEKDRRVELLPYIWHLVRCGAIGVDLKQPLTMDADCNQFVRAAVLPLLYTVPTNVMTRAQLTERLHGWFATLSKEMVIACDDQTDWELLVDVFDGELPANIVRPHRNLRPLIDTTVYNRAVCQYHSVPGQPWHHALHDAKAHRMGWLVWTDLAKKN